MKLAVKLTEIFGFLFVLKFCLNIEFKLGEKDDFVDLIKLVSNLHILGNMVSELVLRLRPHVERYVRFLQIELILCLFAHHIRGRAPLLWDYGLRALDWRQVDVRVVKLLN